MGDCSAIVDDSELGFSSDKINLTSIARQYQLELAKKALDENVIVVLETGCGKTLIAILLMCDMAHLIKKPQKNVCIFLAPTVVLVHQQARVIEQYTDFKVGVYCGDLKHLKTHNTWDSELEQYEVLVMTPQVLLRSLCHCFIKMEAIALLIFDECHYAQIESNHPYAEIMKVFYDVKVTKVPRIFGMTASPICGKGASINGLQALLHAKVYTVNDKTQLETVVVSPVVQVYHYNSNENFSSSHQKCLNKLEEIKRQCTSMLCRNGDDPSRLQNAKKLLQRLHNNVVFALTSLGLWGALQACRILLSGDGWERNELIDAKGNSSDEFIQNEYLAQTVSLLETECMGDVAEGMVDTLKLLREPYFSQKVLRLIGILSNFRSRPDMKCIIFVNRIIIARSLAYILGQIKILSAWKCNYLVGVHSKRMSRKTMYQILDEFRSGELNLLVATKVGEEGLDIQTCCLVIRFDLPETLASFIQSRGRARMAQSEYAFLVDSKSEREMNLMDSFRKDEDLMNLDIRDRKPNGVVADINEEVYSVELTGATISSQTSVSLLYQYCSKLPHDEYYTPMPDFFNVDDTEGIICHIILPSNAPIHHIVSAPQSSKEAAKKDVCLRACKELHQAGALTDYLLPEHDDISKNDSLDVPDSDSTQDEDSPFKLQEMVVPAALKEPWHVVDNLVCLNSYFICFKPKPHDRLYKEFGLFVKDPLPCEAERMNIDLHLAHGRSVLTDLVPSGVARFDEEELLLALNFQEMCLKIILDRSEFTCDHVPLMKKKNSELNSSIFYLMLPVTTQEDSSMSVDWSVIRRCLSSPIFAPLGHLSETPPTLNCSLQLANGPASVNDVLNSLVYVGHRNSFFFVSQILTDKNGYSLQNNSTCHVDHFSEKFGIQLAHPGQPLLQAKQLFCLHNLLHERKTGNFESRELDEYFFEFPPELCEIKIIGFSKDIGSSLSLLPSILHRLENLLVAIELKEKLSKSFVEGAVVTAERVLEALTTEKCLERFSLERLEVLGDAFLKFAVGRHLFLKHEAFDEGQLTRRRSNFISNSNLCKLAIKNQLQGYIRDQAFDSSQFFALGRPCSVICTKQTESVIHCDSEVDLKNGGGGNRQVRCSKNHHWLTKKTIADVVEALVGAYIVDSGFQAAIAFLKWFGIQVEFEASQVCRAWTASSRFMSLADRTRISDIEGILGHHFVRKGLILQALVHPSYNKHGGGCYQRLEFLGDAVLDYLITSYLFSACPDLKPGQLTDLRSSFVNNSSFAQVAASALHKFILYDSNLLRDAINKFVNFIRRPASERHLLEEPPCPKALGDLVESCIGAILLDVGFDLNHLWKVMLSFLDPVMRCSKLQLNPIRELLELSNHHGWIVEFNPSKRNKSFMVEAIVNGKSFRLAASATYRSIKGAKRIAAKQVIEKLKAEGYQLKTKSLDEVLKTLRKREARLIGYDEMPLSLYSTSEWPSAENLSLEDHSNIRVTPELTYGNMTLNGYPNGSASPKPNVYEMPTIISSSQKRSIRSSSQHEHSQHAGNEAFVIDSDGPRKATAKSQLNEICVKNCWKTPVYECCKEEGPSHLRVFTFKVVVVIEDTEDVILECFGKPQAKKKAAAEEAADGALWFLKKQGYIK